MLLRSMPYTELLVVTVFTENPLNCNLIYLRIVSKHTAIAMCTFEFHTSVQHIL